ncbi:DUF1579 domain-containing protein [candidate division GN15 bacterium]|nr:DUF1579 domain-containing protein [candidate division GN15 bacterium]
MKFLTTLFFVMVLAVGVAADDHQQGGAQGMPDMGQPEEMKELMWIEGDWDVAMQSRWDPNQTEWTESKGSCTYTSILDGCAMQFDYTGEAMGMPFLGHGVMSYDRDKKEWQSSWIDNMAARQVLYTGHMHGDSSVMTGHEVYGGMAYDARITTVRINDDKYEWYYDMSMDGGENWWTSGKAIYTRAGK